MKQTLRRSSSRPALSMLDNINNALFAADLVPQAGQRNGAPHPATNLSKRPPHLTDAERHRLLFEWNQTGKEYPRSACIHHLFEAQVARTPMAIALVAGHERLTYLELNARANQLAHHLRTLDCEPETLVAVCLERSWKMIVGILAVLKADAAYVPVDPGYPAERVDFMLKDAKAPLVLTTGACPTIGFPPGTRVVDLDTDWSEIEKQGRENPIGRTECGGLAHVIYTSGSTGQPKGVALEHGGVVALISWAQDIFTEEERAGVLASTSICFDLSVFEMFVPLCSGGKIILAENALALPGLAAKGEVTLINTVPSAIRELLELKAVPDSVLVINLAGEPLATALVNQISAETQARKIYDLYGPTETTTYSTFTLRHPDAPPTIGRPLANEQVYLLDAERELVPIGETGELYIGGAGLARGYLNRPELTQEKFVPHPFSSGDRLYRTGDLARWRSDGNLEFLGRMDHQVKIRGFRIELGEVESVLRQVPGVRDVTVIAREDQPGDQRLVAYAVPKPDLQVTASELRRFVKEKLPDHMVPSFFVLLDALPRTPSGKVDRKALPRPEMAAIERSLFVAPRTETECKVAEIWQTMFQCPDIGLHDSFFEMGGHSLLAVRLVGQINHVFKADLDAMTLLEHPTVETLAQALHRDALDSPEAKLIPMRGGGEGPPVFFLNTPFDFIKLASQTDEQPVFTSHVPWSSAVLQASARLDSHLFPSVPEMAAPHAAMIRERVGSGSCVVAGYSYGGVLAFEVAHQLERDGISVDAVVLFDADLKVRNWQRLQRRARRHVENTLKQGMRYLWRKANARIDYEAESRATNRALAARASTEDFASWETRWEVIHKIWQHALKNYRLRRLPSRGILLRAEETAFDPDYDASLGWARLFADGLEIVTVPGDHHSMWKEPHVEALTREWKSTLRDLRRKADAVLSFSPSLLAALFGVV